MNFRPQFQLRFREVNQFIAVKAAAARDGVSVNEWILRRIDGAVEKAADNAEKEKKRPVGSGCVECGAVSGHQKGCSRR